MLFETASSEIALLIFSVLVPMGVTAMGLIGFFRASLKLSEESAKKADALLSIPALVTIVGLCASFAHLGSPSHVFGMANGIGSSPLSNEIVVAAVAIVAALVYWIFALVKHPAAGAHKAFGIVCCVLGLLIALFTGLAYVMPTIATWNSPVGTVSQLFAALLGGAALAAFVLALAGAKLAKPLALIAVVGAVGVALMVVAQGVMVGDVQNAAGLTLAGSMGQYWFTAVAGIICAAVAAVLAFMSASKEGSSLTLMTLVAALAALVALVLIRICFYGIFLSVGLF